MIVHERLAAGGRRGLGGKLYHGGDGECGDGGGQFHRVCVHGTIYNTHIVAPVFTSTLTFPIGASVVYGLCPVDRSDHRRAPARQMATRSDF